MATQKLTRKPIRIRTPTAPALLHRRAQAKRDIDPHHKDLLHLVRTLQLVTSVVIAAVKALREQSADQDEDIALVLQRHVADALHKEVEKWEGILGLIDPESQAPPSRAA
jgi:hypothetical protein